MDELELFFNQHHKLLSTAVLWADERYSPERLRSLLERTALKKLILTGEMGQSHREALLQGAAQRAVWMDPAASIEPEEPYALVLEGDKPFPMESWQPCCLLGHVRPGNTPAFELWQRYRHCCSHILLVTLRENAQPQVLSWEPNPRGNIQLSVVLPMYNVARYLSKCLETLTAWDSDCVEFLFVNDGSPDNSRQIVLDWMEKDCRIRLLDKPNGGCASARQLGLEQARGRYVGFVDPDDYVDPSMFPKLLAAAMTGSYDISYCGYWEHYENTGEVAKVPDLLGYPYHRGITEPRQVQELIVLRGVSIWRGIYSMEMLRRNHIGFYRDLPRFDDLPFKVETFAAARSVIAVDEHLYYYRLARPGQDVAADDERLYVHFDIFRHLNQSIAARKDPRLTDLLQICKVQTHRYALEKIRPEYLREYALRARADLLTTGTPRRTCAMARKMVGRRSAMLCWAVLHKRYPLLEKLTKQL